MHFNDGLVLQHRASVLHPYQPARAFRRRPGGSSESQGDRAQELLGERSGNRLAAEGQGLDDGYAVHGLRSLCFDLLWLGGADKSTDEGTCRVHSLQGPDAAPSGSAQNPGARTEYPADRRRRVTSAAEARQTAGPLYEGLRAMASISTRAPRGSAATCTVARAG